MNDRKFKYQELIEQQEKHFKNLDHHEIDKIIRNIITEDYNDFGGERWIKKSTLKCGDNKIRTLESYKNLISFMVEYGEKSPIVRNATNGIIQQYEIDPKNDLWVFASIQHWIQNRINYILDAGLGSEIFTTPQRQLVDWARGTSGSDCDDVSILYASMLKSIGKKSAVALIDAHKSSRFNHAIALAKSEKYNPIFNRDWIAVELTIEKPLGWIITHSKKFIID